MARKPNLKRKEQVRFEPLTGERGGKLLQDIAPPEERKIKIFSDLEDEILEDPLSLEEQYLLNHRNAMNRGED
ncbi:MAG: hypothetical protein Q8N21_02540 [bacterium]|nr:hypothetical protein [bacterium]